MQSERVLLTAVVALILAGCGDGNPGIPAAPDGTPTTSAASPLAGHPPALTDKGLVNVIVEIPAGTNEKWAVNKTSGLLEWETQNGKPRIILYLAYPANYGMVPRTLLPAELGGDDDPLDVLVLGPRLERGTLVEARIVGVLSLVDGGERDDKILAVRTSGPLSDAADLETLDARYPGVLDIIETWFENYKGGDRIVSQGYHDADTATEIVREASRYYDTYVGENP